MKKAHREEAPFLGKYDGSICYTSGAALTQSLMVLCPLRGKVAPLSRFQTDPQPTFRKYLKMKTAASLQVT